MKDSWKFAAVEIYSLINQVRENGLDDVHEMETKMRGLLATMKQQTDIVDQLNNDLKHQKQASSWKKCHTDAHNYCELAIAFKLNLQVAAFSDMTTSQLSGDNSLLKDEVDMLRGQLMDANDTIRSLRSEVRLKTTEAERKGRAKQV